MSTADIAISVILLIGAYSGYKKGLILELIGIVAFALAIVGGFKLLHVGMDFLSKMYDGFGNFLPFVAFLAVFVLILMLVNLLGKFIKSVIHLTPFGLVDNLGGALIGIAKGALALSILLWVMTSLNFNLPESFTKNSSILPVVSGFAGQASDFVSAIFPSFKDFMKTLEELFDSFTS